MDNSLKRLYEIQESYPDFVDTERLILKKQLDFQLTLIVFFVVLKETNEKIGEITMVYDGEIWYEIDESFRNQGYVTEAVAKLIDVSQRKYFYLSIIHLNLASIKVARKLGFNLQNSDATTLLFVKEK